MFAVCVLTSATGATSLLTVPLMIQFGVEPRAAIATNMALLVLMNGGSSLGFHGEDPGCRRRLWRLVAITLAGSAGGAWLMLLLPASALRLIVPGAMLAVLAFLLVSRRHHGEPPPPPQWRLNAGYVAALALAVYGGFFSGGYVTMLVAAFTFFFGYTFLRSIALARLMNLASSLIAAFIFALHGAINWPLGGILGVVAFGGAFIGARFARRLPEVWLRRVFTTAVAILAIKSLMFDLL